MWAATARAVVRRAGLRACADASASASAAAAAAAAPEPMRFFGAPRAPYTTQLELRAEHPLIPVYRVLGEDGRLLEGQSAPLDTDTVLRMYEKMVFVNVMDEILYDSQRQGRISFYMTSYCEEAIHMGTAAGVRPEDEMFMQYREQGVLLWRGFTLRELMNQCFSNALDPGKGRQMPVHYGAKHLNVQTISSPLATQIPHAAGAGYAFAALNDPRVAVCYFGEGAASEGDFHAALNMAATRRSATIFICRNNGYAISTPVTDQYAGDGIAARGPAYGIPTVRVDGHDLFAVYNATRAAREVAGAAEREKRGPVLLEMMTYRGGHHSTSDDASRYRPAAEPSPWLKEYSPITRTRRYLQGLGAWHPELDERIVKQVRAEVMQALDEAGKVPRPAISELFNDVFAEPEQHLVEQRDELLRHLKTYGEHYPRNVAPEPLQ